MSTERPVLHLSKPRKPRFKECPICRDRFEVRRLAQKTCEDYRCAITFGKQMAEAMRVKEVRKERREYRVKNKTIGQLLKEVQKEFNRFIRERDFGLPCISCERNTGAKVNAGHYRTTAAASHLRFNEDNVHLQCEHCNTYLSGNIVEYRPRLIAKIGLARVEALEADNTPVHWTREGLMALRRKYVGMWKELKARRL